MSRLRLATRGSALAVAQSRWVAERIERVLGVETELMRIQTSGDRLRDVPLSQIGGKGLFVKEIEEALLEGRADVAVHSAKDLPARTPAGLTLAAFPERADSRDALLVRPGVPPRLLDLPEGAAIATGSARRTAQLRSLRPDLKLQPLRGNVTTRLERLDEGRFDALVLACAGLDRLSLAHRIDERVAPEQLLPAVCQGVLALEVRSDSALVEGLRALDHGPSAAAARAERAFLRRLEGDCNVPIAALAEPAGVGTLRLRGMVSSPDGARSARAEAEGEDPERLGIAVAEAILARGGAEILAALRTETLE